MGKTELIVKALENGTVIDHIPADQTFKVVKLLGIEECPDENWNAAWEAEHPVQELPLGVKIIPHCAFGAGHHETTSMMMESLIANKSYFANRQVANVLDHGTGTDPQGVYSILHSQLHVIGSSNLRDDQ